MKKSLMRGILIGAAVLSCPIQVEAHERQCPKSIEIDYEDAQELMQIAWCEAGNQGIEGQRYVISVILNRVNDESDTWPDTIHEVIHQEGQFATAGMTKAKITPETHYALAEIEMGNVVPEIVAFERKESSSLCVYFDAAFDYRDHTFYTVKH